MNEKPRISVVIVNYNSGHLLADCVKALAAQSVSDFEVLIVDNNSQDASLAAVTQHGDARFRVLPLTQNLGFAGGVNYGVRHAGADWIATLNPDAFPEPAWLQNFLREADRHPEIRLFGSMQISAADEGRLDGCGDCYHATGIPWRGGYGHPVSACTMQGEVFSPCAAAAFYKKDALLEVGGFDESFFCYCEDIDVAFRMRLLGYRCLQLTEARVRHVGSAITGRSSPFSLFHSVRNRMWVVVKNMPGPLLALMFPLHIAATLYLLARCRRRPVFEPQWDGFKAGLAGLPQAWRQRKSIQARRRASSWDIIRAFTWSQRKLRRLETDVRVMERTC